MSNENETVILEKELYQVTVDEMFKMKLAAKFAYIEDDEDYWDAIVEFYEDNPDLFEIDLESGKWKVRSGRYLNENEGIPIALATCFDHLVNYYFEQKEAEKSCDELFGEEEREEDRKRTIARLEKQLKIVA